MQANHISLIRTARLLAGTTLALASISAFGAEKSTAEADAFPVFDNNYIKLAGQVGSFVGDSSAFQARTQQAKRGSNGIESLRLGGDISKEASYQIDAKALTGTDDYLGSVLLSKNEVGSVEFGYKSFRTFYDGVGGFFPPNKQWMPMGYESLHVDRSQFWLDATVALPNKPLFHLRYSNELRDGVKDSTIWGDTDNTGMPNNNPPISQVRKIGPSYIQLGERHENLEASMKHTVGPTTYQLVLVGDSVNNLDTRFVPRFPGEAKPFPAPAATVLLPWYQMNNQVLLWQTDGIEAKTFSVTAKSETVLSPKVTLRTALSYSLLNSDFTGDRPIITTTPTATGAYPVITNQHFGLAGGSRSKVYAGNISFDYKATKDLNVKLALRGEDLYTKSAGTLTPLTTTGTAPVLTNVYTPNAESSRVKEHVATPVFDVRYTGIPHLALYASGSLRSTTGDERLMTPYNTLTNAVPPVGNLFNNDVTQHNGDYTVGASWRQAPLGTFRAEVFQKNHSNKSDGYSTNLGDNYALASQFTGVKLTAIIQPLAQVTATTRYIYQKGEMQVTGVLPGAEKYDSMNAKNHTIGETIDWTPNQQCYVQANVNLVFNVIDTVYPRAGTAPASGTNIAYDVNGIVQNSDNNYLTASVLSGFVVDKEDDLQLQATYYRANDGDAALARLTQPYGADAKDFTATVGLKHKFEDKLVGNFKVGYFHSNNQTTGGFTNYKGVLVCITLDQAF